MKKVLVLHCGSSIEALKACFNDMNWLSEECNLLDGIKWASEEYDAFLICADESNLDVVLGAVRFIKSQFKAAVVVLDDGYSKQFESKLLLSGIDMYLSSPIDFRNVCKYVAFNSVKYDLVESKVIRYKDLVLDIEKRLVCRGEKCIELRNKEFDLLMYLLQNPGMVFSKTRILEAVWDMNALTNTTTVESHVSTLRRKLDKDFDERLLHTVHCVGYKIE